MVGQCLLAPAENLCQLEQVNSGLILKKSGTAAGNNQSTLYNVYQFETILMHCFLVKTADQPLSTRHLSAWLDLPFHWGLNHQSVRSLVVRDH